MDKLLRVALCALTAAGIGGCAWVPQNVTLKPAPVVVASSMGHGVTVAVHVVDRRRSPVLGHRGLDSKNAAIRTEQDVGALIRGEITDGLARKGFAAARFEGQPGRLLTVEIQRIDYTTDMDFWKGIVQAEAVLNVSTIKDGSKFERAYSGSRMETTVEAPRAKTNQRLINGAISDALQRLLEDERLLRFLTE
jgi:uncharacterized lipoprotein